MAIDLSVANSNPLQRLIIRLYRSHTGAVAGGYQDKSVWFRQNNNGTQADIPVHVQLSLGKEHLWLSIEGPRGGQPYADSALGSIKNDFFVCDLEPYFPTEDTDPTLVCSSNRPGIAFDQSNLDGQVFTYNQTQDFRNSKLGVVSPASGVFGALNRLGYDGNLYLSPYVVHEDQQGMRGRLKSIFHAGYNYYDSGEAPIVSMGTKVNYAGDVYKIVAPYRSAGIGYYQEAGSLGYIYNRDNAMQAQRSVLVAVPTV
jgi:hypothetical protein